MFSAIIRIAVKHFAKGRMATMPCHVIYKSGLLKEIQKIIDPLVRNSNLLAFNQTTNEVERFISLVAQCTAGKRINFTKRNSYTTRWHIPMDLAGTLCMQKKCT
ncbi:hypothetical protein ILUMI_18597 [Ignelater luminosus]|uniref:Uncharacterized protein n=1 Tax=Ignelater luminosus TaxID=2038154 RepID=A0A8K0CPT9_IGNLU|nr:hypothetical protein ILUMI_18597 [Ignelater luminosus]